MQRFNCHVSHQVFYELKDPECCLNTVLSSCSVFQSEMAIAACTALTPHLSVLAASGINALCLRVSTQTDMVNNVDTMTAALNELCGLH